MDKLSELSKPKAFVVTGGKLYQDRAFTDKSTAERSKADRHDGAVVEPLYSQEYVSALLAELEETESRRKLQKQRWRKQLAALRDQAERIKSLEHQTSWDARNIAELRAKLATPVRLPAPSSALDLNEFAAEWRDCGIAESATVLREQGFTVGDE